MTSDLTSPLQSAFARLAWADGHIARLGDLVATYAGSALHVTEVSDPATGLVRHTASALGEPPADVALCLGDVLQQLRATLDTAVGSVRPAGPSNRSAFPLETDPARWADAVADRLEALPPWAVEAIRQVQPFPDNDGRWVGEELVILHELAIRDRHRALLVAGSWADLQYVSHDGVGDGRLFRPGADLRSFVTEYPAATHPSPRFSVAVLLVEPIEGRPEYLEIVDAAAVARRAVAAALSVLERARPR